MTFGKYKRVLNGDERWKSLKWVERETFIECLNEARLACRRGAEVVQ